MGLIWALKKYIILFLSPSPFCVFLTFFVRESWNFFLSHKSYLYVINHLHHHLLFLMLQKKIVCHFFVTKKYIWMYLFYLHVMVNMCISNRQFGIQPVWSMSLTCIQWKTLHFMYTIGWIKIASPTHDTHACYETNRPFENDQNVYLFSLISSLQFIFVVWSLCFFPGFAYIECKCM